MTWFLLIFRFLFIYLQEGEEVGIQLKIGMMTCVEYCAMMGYEDMLRTLVESSVHANILAQYFALTGMATPTSLTL